MILEVTVGVLLLLYLFYKWHFSYWKRRNVFSLNKELNYPIVKGLLWDRKLPIDVFRAAYTKHKNERLIGFFILYKPAILVTDPELVQTVLVKDFNKFVDTATVIEEKTDPVFCHNPFVAKGMERWKEIRGIQAAMQTATKFKEMFPDMVKCADKMVSYLKNGKTKAIEVRDVLFRYTVDNTCAACFGLEPTAFTDPENRFLKHATGEKIFASGVAFLFHTLMPFISNLFRVRITSEEVQHFLDKMVENVIDHREKTGVVRNDLIDYILKLNKKYEMLNKKAYSKNEIAGHLMTFYVDSADSTSIVLSYLLFDLASNQDVQEKLRQEISSVSENAEKFDLDQINSLKYMTMVIHESLRCHSLVDWLHRTCTESTTLGGKQISKGTLVYVPIAAFYSDPEYFPEPNKFDPERFSDKNKDSIVPFSFLPFGGGPRICVGFKYALLQIKVALVYLLLNFKILPSSEKEAESMADLGHPFRAPTKDSMLLFEPL